MFLIDTNVVSENRRRERANRGVAAFFKQVIAHHLALYLSVITIGELRRGVELIRRRGDIAHALQLEIWLTHTLEAYRENILPLDEEVAQIWGKLRVPHHEHALDKQIAATALMYDLTLVTRNVSDFAGTGVRLLNPFSD